MRAEPGRQVAWVIVITVAAVPEVLGVPAVALEPVIVASLADVVPGLCRPRARRQVPELGEVGEPERWVVKSEAHDGQDIDIYINEEGEG